MTALNPLRRHFKDYARPDLPGGLTAAGFRHERYVSVHDHGPDRIIHELLVDIAGQNNESFFTEISRTKQGAEADRYLVFKALDHAREKNIFPVAINVYPESAGDKDFIDGVLDYLETYGLHPDNLILELLEHTLTTAETDLSGLAYGVEKGLRFAIDDFDPRAQGGRLEALAPYCRFLKFDKHVLWDFQANRYQALPNVVRDIRERYADLRLIAEGISPALNNEYAALGFDATQSNTHLYEPII